MIFEIYSLQISVNKQSTSKTSDQIQIRRAKNKNTNDKYITISLSQPSEYVDQVLQLDCSYILKPSNTYEANNQHHFIYNDNVGYSVLKEIMPLTEPQIWELLKCLINVIYVLEQKQLSITSLNQNLILFDPNINDFKFISYFNVKQIKSKSKDINLVQLLLQKLMPKTPSIPLSKLSEIMLQFPLKTLITHPLLYIDKKHINSIIYQTDFKLSDFTIIKTLGEGAFGRCDLAKYKKTLEYCVLKSTTNTKSQDVEVQMLRQITHPNVVRFYGSFTENRTHYIVMQFCNKGDLFDRLTKNTLPGKDSLFEWVCELSSAIYYMHSHKLIHRDIKPQNVLINDSYAMLADFGVSRSIEEFASTIIGTPLYFSPEQHYKQQYTSAADIFSLGLVFFNMTVGSHPFTSTHQDQNKFYNYVKSHGGAGAYCNFVKDPFMKQLISKMLVFDPERRILAEDICRMPEIKQYLYKHGLPGPELSDILTSKQIIQIGQRVPYQMYEIATLGQKHFEYLKNLIKKSQIFAPIILQSLSNFFINQIRNVLGDVDSNNEYYNTQINFEAEQVKKLLQRQLQIEDICELQTSQIIQKNNIIQTETCYASISSVISEIKPANVIVCLGQAFYVQNPINISADTVIIVCSHLMNENSQQINITAKRCFIGFQKHNGKEMQITVRLQNNKQPVYYGALNQITTNCDNVPFEKLKTVQDEEITGFIQFINKAYPDEFIGDQGWKLL